MKLFRSLLFLLAACLAFSPILHSWQPPKEMPIVAYAHNRNDQRKGTLAVCAIFKSEASFLKEWIEFHRLVGVTHFFLYNNCSTDNYLEVLNPYISDGTVELFDVPFDSTPFKDGAQTHNYVQRTCYNHAIELAKGFNTWLAIIDTDEFICPVTKDDIPSILKHYKEPAVVVYWQVYGTSRVWELKPGELLIEKLMYKFPRDYYPNQLFKSIVRPEYATSISPHECRYTKKHAVTTKHKRFTFHPSFTYPPINVLRINHYTYRTESFFHEVKKPRRADWGFVPYTPEEEKQLLDQSNTLYDPIMERFIPQLKERMKTKG